MYAASSSRIAAIGGLPIAGRPAKPAPVIVWTSNGFFAFVRWRVVSDHTAPGQPRPGIRMIGRPLPVTSTVNAVGSNLAGGDGAASGSGSTVATTGSGTDGGASTTGAGAGATGADC